MGKKKVQPATAKSNFSGVNNYAIDLDGLGTGTATKSGDTISSSSALSDPYKQLQTSALSGLQAQQNTLGKDPTQLYQDIQSGSNPFYNAYNEQAKLQNQANYDQLQSRMSHAGLSNSTTFGGYAAQQANQQVAQDAALRSQALSDQLGLANSNAASNQNTLNGLASLQQYLTQVPSQSIMQGLGNADQVAMFNAQQQQQANMQNAQRPSVLGNILGAGLGLGAMFIPGMQGVGASMLGGSVMSGLRGMSGGGASQGFGSSLPMNINPYASAANQQAYWQQPIFGAL
jgi:hypothetical protein